MIQVYEEHNSCHMLLSDPITPQDIESLTLFLARAYRSFHLEFGRIYNLNSKMINLLYDAIYVKNLQLTITTHKSRLNHYLRELGFAPTFHSILRSDVKSTQAIDTIVIGGSADSSMKIKQIVKEATFANLTLIIVQHVEAEKKGMLDTILQPLSKEKIYYAKDGMRVEKATIYIAPSSKHLKVENGFFRLTDEAKHNYAKPSISLAYKSLSAYYKERLLVIQECGYGEDGVDAMEVLKENGSLLIIQDKEECEAKAMVQNAMLLNLHDYMLSTQRVVEYIHILDIQKSDEALREYLLEEILRVYAYDFRSYHKDLIERRLSLFMLKHSIKTLKDAVTLILFNRHAFKVFFLDLSINVTELFRNPKSFEAIADLLQKDIYKKHSFKIWSAGCSSGEEIYSLAILLESLGMLQKAILYATDFNKVVIQEAKSGLYSLDSLEKAKKSVLEMQVPIDLEKYITKNKKFITIDEKIRKKTHFFEHNLIEDGSFNEFDIIICKNVIIYFNDALQKKVLQLFYDSLKFGGYLVLGESELLQKDFFGRFTLLDAENKIFKKVA